MSNLVFIAFPSEQIPNLSATNFPLLGGVRGKTLPLAGTSR
jgi:hypothetical protein